MEATQRASLPVASSDFNYGFKARVPSKWRNLSFFLSPLQKSALRDAWMTFAQYVKVGVCVVEYKSGQPRTGVEDVTQTISLPEHKGEG